MIPSKPTIEEIRDKHGAHRTKTEVAVLRLDEGPQPATAHQVAQRVNIGGGMSSKAAATILRGHPQVEHEPCPDRGVHVYWIREARSP